jgi:predicted ester cyclase
MAVNVRGLSLRNSREVVRTALPGAEVQLFVSSIFWKPQSFDKEYSTMIALNISLFLTGIMLITFAGVSQVSADTTANKAVVERWLDLWNTRDLAIADEVLATDFVSHIPPNPDVTDLESYKKEVVKTGTGVPDFHAEIHDIVAEGDKVAGRFTTAGTMQPAGVPYTNTWIVIFRFADGKIVEEWWELDMLGVMQQLGAIPPASEGLPAMQRAAPEDFVWSAPSDVTGDPGDPEPSKALVMREFDAWNQGDADAAISVFDEIHSADFVNHDPARPQVTDAASYIKWAVEESFPFFPDFHWPVEDIIAEGDKVVVRWSCGGTFTVIGKKITQTGITIYRIADGRIVEEWCACDMLDVIQQIGAATLEANKAGRIY